MPVTHGVAGSSPVQTAKSFGENSGAFVFIDEQCIWESKLIYCILNYVADTAHRILDFNNTNFFLLLFLKSIIQDYV